MATEALNNNTIQKTGLDCYVNRIFEVIRLWRCFVFSSSQICVTLLNKLFWDINLFTLISYCHLTIITVLRSPIVYMSQNCLAWFLSIHWLPPVLNFIWCLFLASFGFCGYVSVHGATADSIHNRNHLI